MYKITIKMIHILSTAEHKSSGLYLNTYSDKHSGELEENDQICIKKSNALFTHFTAIPSST